MEEIVKGLLSLLRVEIRKAIENTLATIPAKVETPKRCRLSWWQGMNNPYIKLLHSASDPNGKHSAFLCITFGCPRGETNKTQTVKMLCHLANVYCGENYLTIEAVTGLIDSLKYATDALPVLRGEEDRMFEVARRMGKEFGLEGDQLYVLTVLHDIQADQY